MPICFLPHCRRLYPWKMEGGKVLIQHKKLYYVGIVPPSLGIFCPDLIYTLGVRIWEWEWEDSPFTSFTQTIPMKSCIFESLLLNHGRCQVDCDIHSLARHFLSTNIYQKAVRNCLCFQLLSVGGICQRTHHSDVIIGPGGRSPVARIIMTTTTLSDYCVWIHSKKQDWEKKSAQESFNLYIIETVPDPSGKVSSFRIGYGWAFFLHGLGPLASFWQ